jgi:tungstate transport system ATP-binding protein
MNGPAKNILPLSVRNLCFEAGGQRLIKDISFTLAQAGRTVILGHNGAGKSLLLRLCHGLIRPTSGEIRWQGAGGVDPALRQAMVFQRPVMLRRSAAANVEYALRLRHIPVDKRRALVAEALRRTKLHRHADTPARVLSFGEQQRLALARAWALKPDVLFLDEPTASLDPSVTLTIEALIDAIRESGTKIVMTTHDMGQARRMADDILFLHRGRLVEQATADELFDAPQSEEARAFIAGELFW